MPKNRKRAILPPHVSNPIPAHLFRTGGVGFQEAPSGGACERCGNTHELALITVVAPEETPDVPSVSSAMTLCSACLAEAYHAARGVRFPERQSQPVAVVHDLATGRVKLY